MKQFRTLLFSSFAIDAVGLLVIALFAFVDVTGDSTATIPEGQALDSSPSAV